MGFFDAIGTGVGTILGNSAPLLPDWAQPLLPLLPALTGGGGATPALTPPGGKTFTIGGPSGISFTSGGPAPAVPVQAGGKTGLVPDAGSIDYSTIRTKMDTHLGFAPRRKTVMFMLRRMGADFTSSALGLDQNDILWLYTHRRTSSRRHYLQTYTKWIRRGENARKTLAPLAHRAVRAARSRRPSRGRARAR